MKKIMRKRPQAFPRATKNPARFTLSQIYLLMETVDQIQNKNQDEDEDQANSVKDEVSD